MRLPIKHKQLTSTQREILFALVGGTKSFNEIKALGSGGHFSQGFYGLERRGLVSVSWSDVPVMVAISELGLDLLSRLKFEADHTPMRKGDWIITAGGTKFYPLDPHPDEIHGTDIARALAMQCRWTGHVPFHYSVAQHCVLGTDALGATHGPEVQLAFLLHDASEAYLADVSRPVKRDPRMAFYKRAEARLLEVIHRRFGLPTPSVLLAYNVIHVMDNQMLMAEAKVFHGNQRHWRPWEGAELPPIKVDIQPWTPEIAEVHYFGALQILMQGKPFKLRQRYV